MAENGWSVGFAGHRAHHAAVAEHVRAARGWTCTPNYTGTFGTLPTCPGGSVEMRVYFPQCWDGSRRSA
jgi:hypothetical protein